MPRKNRSANFSPSETKIFMKIIDKYKHVFDIKGNDGSTNQKKALAWVHVANIFNRLSTRGIYRDADQLKQKFVNSGKLQRRRERQQLARTEENGDEVPIEKYEESMCDSMDPLDFEQSTESTSSSFAIEKPKNVQKSTSSMNNDCVLNLLEGFVADLRKKCGRADTSNAPDRNDAVSGKSFFFYLFLRRN